MTDIVLTEREHQVLLRMSYGHRNGRIGRDLCIGEATVKTHAKAPVPQNWARRTGPMRCAGVLRQYYRLDDPDGGDHG